MYSNDHFNDDDDDDGHDNLLKPPIFTHKMQNKNPFVVVVVVQNDFSLQLSFNKIEIEKIYIFKQNVVIALINDNN